MTTLMQIIPVVIIGPYIYSIIHSSHRAATPHGNPSDSVETIFGTASTLCMGGQDTSGALAWRRICGKEYVGKEYVEKNMWNTRGSIKDNSIYCTRSITVTVSLTLSHLIRVHLST